MMKKVFALFVLTAITTSASFAQTAAPAADPPPAGMSFGNPSSFDSNDDQDSKEKIDPSGLPDAVKTTLAGDDYKEWSTTAAWKAGDNYIVALKNGDEIKTVTFDKDGKQVG